MGGRSTPILLLSPPLGREGGLHPPKKQHTARTIKSTKTKRMPQGEKGAWNPPIFPTPRSLTARLSEPYPLFCFAKADIALTQCPFEKGQAVKAFP